jgi:anti-anti-sigma regulatory factor
MRLRIDVQQNGRNLLLVCKGEIVQGEEAEYLYNLITKRNAENITVDLSSVSYIDEGGSIMLLLCHSLLAGTRRRLSFQNPSAAAMEGFRLRQLDSIFGLADIPSPSVAVNATARSAVM